MIAYDFNATDSEDAEIIQFSNRMTLPEIKLLYLFLTMAMESPDKRRFSVDKPELERLLGVSRLNNTDLKDRLNSLVVQTILIEEPDAVSPVLVFDRIQYEQNWLGTWECHFTCSEKVLELMRDKVPFPSADYYCRTAAELNTKRSFLLFVYLLKHKDEDRIQVALPELRSILDASDKYESFKEFNRNILQKSVNEILEKTDLRFSYLLGRRGAKIVGVQFDFEKDDEPEKTPFEQKMEFFRTAFDDIFTVQQTEEIYNLIKDLPLPEHQMGREFAIHDFLREMYLILKRYSQAGKVNNEYVYFLRMIRNKKEEIEGK